MLTVSPISSTLQTPPHRFPGGMVPGRSWLSLTAPLRPQHCFPRRLLRLVFISNLFITCLCVAFSVFTLHRVDFAHCLCGFMVSSKFRKLLVIIFSEHFLSLPLSLLPEPRLHMGWRTGCHPAGHRASAILFFGLFSLWFDVNHFYSL